MVMKCSICGETIGSPGHLMYLCPKAAVVVQPPEPPIPMVAVQQTAVVVQESKQQRWRRSHPEQWKRINREGQARRRASK